MRWFLLVAAITLVTMVILLHSRMPLFWKAAVCVMAILCLLNVGNPLSKRHILTKQHKKAAKDTNSKGKQG